MKLLESERWRLWLEPASGVQWMAAEVYQDECWVPVVADCRPPVEGSRAGQDESSPLTAANFHMIPYSNRIRDGQFKFEGSIIQLEHGDIHSLHGALRKLPWTITKETSTEFVCTFASPADGPINWPWPLTAEIHYTVKDDTILSTIRVRNDGSTPMPVGFGWHPYFVRYIGGESPEILAPVAGVYPDTNGDCLPTGPSVPLPPELDFRHARVLDKNQRIDHCFSGLQGSVSIAWPQSNIHLKMQASSNCTHLVLFNPDKPHFAIEPVTNANDAFNLAERGIDSGMMTIAPGAWASGEFALTVQ